MGHQPNSTCININIILIPQWDLICALNGCRTERWRTSPAESLALRYRTSNRSNLKDSPHGALVMPFISRSMATRSEALASFVSAPTYVVTLLHGCADLTRWSSTRPAPSSSGRRIFGTITFACLAHFSVAPTSCISPSSGWPTRITRISSLISLGI
uniref:Uncharacterized protein n=1 Tax=Manihot esculenta TaxID=3983 RepID=A0A2C9WNQ6_MANES